MADYLDSEAEVSEDEDEILERKRSKKVKSQRYDDEEEEDDDEEQLAEEMKDLIDDNEVEEEEASSDEDVKRKREEEEEDLYDDRLDDDDYNLLEENLGVKLQRKRFKRLRRLEDDESDDDEGDTSQKPEKDREAIANELFEGSDEEAGAVAKERQVSEDHAPADASEEEGEYSDPDDFIVDDDGEPVTKRKSKKPRYTNAALQEAQDIFGVDFDFNEFENYGDEYEEEAEEDEDYDEEVVDGESRPRPKKAVKKKHTRKSIFEVYEPSELERGHFTDKDNEIRATDVPERFQLRGVPVTAADDAELDEEADWIYKHAFQNPYISKQTSEKVDTPTKAPTAAAAQAAAAAPTNLADEFDDDGFGDVDGCVTAKPTTSGASAVVPSHLPDEFDDDGFGDVDGCTAAPPPKPAEEPAAAPAGNPAILKKIRNALDFMRNQQLEVPFIAFYRKEYVEPDLNINDLWKVFIWDEKWCQLRIRKGNLRRLFEKMQMYQCDEVMKDPEKPLSEDMRVISDEDFERLKAVQTFEELKDIYTHFILYYGQDIPTMQETMLRKRREERAARKGKKLRKKEKVLVDGEEVEADVEDPDEPEEELEEEEDEKFKEEENEKVKQAVRVDAYSLCRRAGLEGLAKKFGLTPQQFGENLRDNYQRHEVEQYPVEPMDLAQEYVNPTKFLTPEDALKGARFMVATQISREPLVRQCVRGTYFERAKIHVHPTKKGIKEIEENHPCYTMKYLKDKLVKDLAGEQFLKLVLAEEEGLLKITLGLDMLDKNSVALSTYIDEIKQLYYRDEFSNNVQEWNKQRAMVLEMAFNKMLYPVFQKELRMKLLQESKDCIVRASCRRLANWLKVAPFKPDTFTEDDEDYDVSEGIRVAAIAFVPDWETAAYCVMVDGDGEVTNYLRLPHILKRKDAWREADREGKERDMEVLKDFIATEKPHVIAVGAESRDALKIVDDVKVIIGELAEVEQLPVINVEIIDNEMSKVYMASKKAENDFRDYPELLRQAISLARRFQDPLIEFSQLCTPDEEIMCLKYHTMQEHISKEDLIAALYLEFINRTNEVGVDVNRALAHPHTNSLVQFVCGLGPRKGTALLKTMKQANSRLENRTQLVTVCHLGPKVFINCAGFIKIDTNSLGDSTEAYVEVLDGSRVHPETYEWARKMAVDALEYDDTAEDANPAGALEEILENPEKLKDLDLDAFAEELERQGFGNRSITLYDIRAELNHRYKDLRTPFIPPDAEEKFNLLTKESPETFYQGKLVLARVMGIARKKPQGEQLDNANPVRNDETGLWQCPFCLKNDFLEVSEVWNHFDAGSCPGQASGVKARLDNGVFGFVPIKFISDKHVVNPEERVQIGMTLHCRIMKIDINRFQVDLTCRSSDLADKNNEWRPTKDVYYDYDAEEKDKKSDEERKKRQVRQTYIKRVIVHPSFHNISFKEAEKILSSMEQGEVVVRPSSKGADHLTVTWKVCDGVYQHIDVREEGKENAFSLGQSLWINNVEFEDLDEIIARHIQPMAAFARDILNFRYYRDTDGGKREVADKTLMDEKKKAPSKIHYILSASREFPGKFLLSYLPRNKGRHEFVTVTPDGFRYRGTVYHSLNSMFVWFKEHFRDPIPGTPASATGRTPMGQSSFIGNTPSINLASLDPQAIQRAAQNMPSHVYNTLSQVASQTPSVHGGQYSSGFGGYSYHNQTPITTPMMTPSYHAISTPNSHNLPTPRYQATPSQTWAQPAAPPPRTPTHRQSSSASQQQPQQQRSHTTPSSSSQAVDWRKAAEMWAKQRQQQHQQQQGSVTPRGGVTPRSMSRNSSALTRISNSPMVESTPTGDATPLIDEH